MVIFIDESGTLPDKIDKYLVLTALVAANPDGLKKILPKFRKKIPTKGVRKKEKKAPEFKFHYVGDITRVKVLEEIVTKEVEIYLLIVDKMGRKIKDTPVNFGKLLKNLITPLLKEENLKEIYIDKHFGSKTDSEELQSILNSITDQIKFYQVDSNTDSRVDLADFVAGSTLRKLRTGDETFYNIIAPKITWEKIRKWNKLK